MTLASEATEVLIEQFGEIIEVIPKGDNEPEDEDNPIYFNRTEESDSSFEEKVRIYSSPSEEILSEYGFEQDTEAVIYNSNGSIDEGDAIRWNDDEFIVKSKTTKQIGNGPYRWVYDIRRRR